MQYSPSELSQYEYSSQKNILKPVQVFQIDSIYKWTTYERFKFQAFGDFLAGAILPLTFNNFLWERQSFKK